MKISMAGKTYFNLEAIKPVSVNKAGNTVWLFSCSCGNKRVADGYSVRSGKVRSCKECAKDRLSSSRRTHGKSGTVEFSIWSDMRTRCYNKNHN